MGFNLSEADTKSNPMKAVAAVQQMMYNWESRDLWNQMSPDYFFSAVLLRSLHPGAPLRHNLLQETQKFLRERSSSTAPASTDKNPLFTFAVTYLQNIQESRGFVSGNSNQHKTQPNASPEPDTNLLVLNSLLQPVPLLLPHRHLMPLQLPALLARIHTNMKARPSTPEPSVPYPALFLALPMSTFNTLLMVIPNVTSL